MNLDWWRMKSLNLYFVCKGPNHFYGPNLQMLYLFLYLVLPLVSRICMTRYASWVCGCSLVWEYVQVELVGGQWLGKPPWLFGSYPYWIVLKIDIYTYRMREIPFLYVTHTKICNIYFNAFPYSWCLNSFTIILNCEYSLTITAPHLWEIFIFFFLFCSRKIIF